MSPELKISDLWMVHYMDEKWGQLQNRKKNVRREFKGESLRDGYLRNEPGQDPSDVAEVAT